MPAQIVYVPVYVKVDAASYELNYGRTDDIVQYTRETATSAVAEQFKLLGWGKVAEQLQLLGWDTFLPSRDAKVWVTDLDPAEGPYPFGEATVGIVDDAQGGIVAYVHRDEAVRVRAALAQGPAGDATPAEL